MNSPAQPALNFQNWKLTLAYDGTDFHGWQIQPGEATVQGELQRALGWVVGESPLPQGSGRTDAGVHALGQVASVALAARIPPENLVRALNRTLPASIRVLEAVHVRPDFHARHSVISKIYEYRVYQEHICPPHRARFVYACDWPMNLDLLQQAAQMFVGEHDFRSFAATDPDLKTRQAGSIEFEAPSAKRGAVRTIFSSCWEQKDTADGRILVYRVCGNGFLHHMVRNLVGTMLDVGRGYTKLDAIPGILAARAREAAGPTAPPQGLFLHSVQYPDASHPAADKP